MSLTNSMNNFPIKHIPQVWFLSRREHLETHYETLSNLQDGLLRFTGSQNIMAVLEAAESLNQLIGQIRIMEEEFEPHFSTTDDYDPYNKNNLRRIKELASSTGIQLESIARQISWGISYDKQVGQVRRNLPPLTKLIEIILKWIEQSI